MHAPSSAALLLVLTMACVTSAVAQQAPAPQPPAGARPKIGLALGGGSARGLAHVGVLRWFEEHRIPIDVITGTSMGGLIAGAYASGMTPDEIATLMRATDWDLMFVADSPFSYKTFRRKQDKRDYPSQLEFGLKGGFRLPSGINPGQQVALLLDQIALPYWNLGSFDDLPTPYRCVATDLAGGKAVVLGRGPLSQAMRATMAIPGLFTPVNYETQLLVDGGALNNIPADVTREMGASLVVAVNVAADEPATTGPDSMFSLLGKTIDAMMAGGTRKALESADLVIDPNLEGLDSMAWRKSDDLAQRGYEAAAAMAGKLAPYAMSEADYAAFQAARQSRRRTERPVIAFVDVNGLLQPLTDDVKQVIGQEFKNQIGVPLDPAVMREDILRVTGTDRYEYLTYRAIERDGRTGVNVIVRQKTYGPPFLALSLELSNVDSSSFSVNFGGRITTYDVLGAGSELRVDLGLGTHQIAAAELYRPIRRDSGFFVAPRGYFERDGLNLFSGGEYVAQYRTKESGGAIDFGYTTNQRFEMRLGYELSDLRARRYIGDPILPEVAGTQGSSRLQVVFDGQDSPIVPSHGFYSRSTLTHFDRTADVTSAPETTPPENPDHFTQGEVTGTWFRRVRGQDRIFAAYGAGTSFGENPLYNVFRLGGPLRLGAFRSDEVLGANYALGDLGYLKRIGRLPDVLGGNVFVGSWLETGSAWDEWKDSDWHTNVSAGAIAESLIGPIFAGASFGKSDWRFFVSIGPLFR